MAKYPIVPHKIVKGAALPERLLMFEVKIKRWGGSLVFPIPPLFREALGLEYNDDIRIYVFNGRLVAEPANGEKSKKISVIKI